MCPCAQKGQRQNRTIFEMTSSPSHVLGGYAKYVLSEAIKGGGKEDVETIRVFIQEGLFYPREDDTDGALLAEACKYGHVEVVRLLIGHGADVFAGDGATRRWFTQAGINGHTEILLLLLDHYDRVDRANKPNKQDLLDVCLYDASANDHTNLMLELMRRGADPTDGFALYLASEMGNVNAVRLLLEDGRAYAYSDKECLRTASSNGHTEVVGLLLREEGRVGDLCGPV